MVTGRPVFVLAALGACAARFRCLPERRAGLHVFALADRDYREPGAAFREDVRARWWAARAGRDD